MSGPTIGNWNKFDANVFKSISGVPDENTQRLEGQNSAKSTNCWNCAFWKRF